VILTGTDRSLAGGAYAERRAECRAAAAALGVPALRDADLADADRLDGVLRRRARHVVSENLRVLRVGKLLREGDVASVGAELTASHASLRDDFEVSAPALDSAVEAAVAAGALGARITGGGFGGAVVALPRPGAVERVADSAAAQVLRTRGADGGRRVA
jgi:galactokinase